MVSSAPNGMSNENLATKSMFINVLSVSFFVSSVSFC